ncbi:MFS transporter [Streptomyces buecherae]|uniref:MFS transporter n=1 Tax=Streptomyces buecherae TaxID=2763006 RepID=A0A7H8N5J3_9ACTN|nr:MFS transporter [Streptomyces buecherae]QKW49784.1 MFS transporter [Streptomyces buecherae]
MSRARDPLHSHPAPATAPAGTALSRSGAAWLTAAGIVLIAFNLRLAISSSSALLEQVRAQLGFGPLVASLVPTLPTLCFAAVGSTSAMLARRVGTEPAVFLALGALCAGLALRGVPHTGALLAGTLLGAAGLAVCNVLLPAVVKAHFPAHVALLTGVYTTTMALGSAVAAAAAVPAADLLGRPSLGLAVWGVPALLALVLWSLRPDSWRAPARRAEGGADSAWRVGRTRFGLLVTAFFALQSLSSYAVIGWLPTILTDHGMSPDRAGLMLGVALVVGVPSTFALLPLTRTGPRLRLAFVVLGASLTAGYLGLLCAPLAVPTLWAVLTGIGLGAFPLVLAIIGGSGHSPQETAALSTFAQSAGYLLASAGPLGLGLARSATGSWALPLLTLLVLAALQLLVGLALTGRRAR